jgi:CRP-like cAMP-binding protein
VSDRQLELDALRGTPFFRSLSDGDLKAILDVGGPASFEAGQTIVREGDPGDGMFVIVSGNAEVDVGGRFHRLGPGDFFGEMALIGTGPRMATVKATTPVQALKVPAADFQSFLLANPRIALSMMRSLVERLREVQQRIDAWMAP